MQACFPLIIYLVMAKGFTPWFIPLLAGVSLPMFINKKYKNIKGDSFDWLYVDFQTLSLYAAGNGFEAELIKEGEHYDYLTRLRWKG